MAASTATCRRTRSAARSGRASDRLNGLAHRDGPRIGTGSRLMKWWRSIFGAGRRQGQSASVTGRYCCNAEVGSCVPILLQKSLGTCFTW